MLNTLILFGRCRFLVDVDYLSQRQFMLTVLVCEILRRGCACWPQIVGTNLLKVKDLKSIETKQNVGNTILTHFSLDLYLKSRIF